MNVVIRRGRRTGAKFRKCVRSSGGECGCDGRRFSAAERFCIAREDGCKGQILSVRQIHDQVFHDTILTCTRVDVTDAEAVERATQDVVKDFGSIRGWYDTFREQTLSNI